MKKFLKFIYHIPGFYRLYKDYEIDPEGIRFIFNAYSEVIQNCTGGKLSKLSYYPYVVTTEIDNYYYDKYYDMWHGDDLK